MAGYPWRAYCRVSLESILESVLESILEGIQTITVGRVSLEGILESVLESILEGILRAYWRVSRP